MKVCEQGHEPIVFDDSAIRAECPLCKAISEIDEADDVISDLRDEITDLTDKISALEGAG